MKKIVLNIIVLVSVIFTSFSQEACKFFEYDKMIRPINENFTSKGKQQGIVEVDNNYWVNLVCPIQKETLSNEFINYLCSSDRAISVTIYLDMEGNIFYCTFFA